MKAATVNSALPDATKPAADFEISAGNLFVYVARTAQEIEAAQRLRYRIFYGEMGGTPPARVAAEKRDFDEFDDVCDHLLVVDRDRSPAEGQVVGTYRLLRRSAAKKLGRFYSESEYDVSKVKALQGEILELGRSCVDEAYRNRAVMQLLWRGNGAYVAAYDIKLMFGCASFNGVDPQEHAQALSYLHHFHPTPENVRPRALHDQYVNMDILPKEQINQKRAFTALPALIKGYLRLQGTIGDGAVIDRQCNTVDVSVIVQTELVTDKYFQRYGSASAQADE